MTFAVPLRERFAACIEAAPNGCWYWTGTLSRAGYGVISAEPELGRRRARQLKAYRLAFELFGGCIEEGKQLDHVCHSLDMSCPGGPGCLHRRCVNPAHLEVVTSLENTMRGAPVRKTHCAHGHEWTPENTYIRRTGVVRQRTCKTCNREAARKWWRSHRAKGGTA